MYAIVTGGIRHDIFMTKEGYYRFKKTKEYEDGDYSKLWEFYREGYITRKKIREVAISAGYSLGGFFELDVNRYCKVKIYTNNGFLIEEFKY